MKPFKEFGPSSWAIDNRVTMFLITFLIVVVGAFTWTTLPKENFPEIALPTIYVGTVYPGTSPADMENLVTRKIEKELKGVSGVKKITSNSIQDFATIFVEFETTVDVEEAKKDVQDAVDKAKSNLPDDLPRDPMVMDINLSELPIMYVNVSGDFDNVALKRYGEDLKDEIEELPQITRVDIVGAREKEIKVDVDLYQMQAKRMTFTDIENALAYENLALSGGQLDMNNRKVSVQLSGEFKTVEDIRQIVVKGFRGETAYLHEIAHVYEGFADRDSYARLNGKPVITLNVVKKSGKNLVEASDAIKGVIDEMKASKFPQNLTISVSGDQSQLTRNNIKELIDTIIIGFLLVTLILMFFMGLRDALFVAFAIPLSSFIAFMLLPILGFSMNLVVLFTFILALGIVVDDAVVVVENIHRILLEEKLPVVQAAKKATGEVIVPVLSGTMTTIMPFVPLMFWQGVIGKFMFFMPVVMILALTASLIVAYVISPVFAVTFMNKEDHADKPKNWKKLLIYSGIAILLGIIVHFMGGETSHVIGNFIIFCALFGIFYEGFLGKVVNDFQHRGIFIFKEAYRALLRRLLRYRWLVMVGMVVLFVGAFMFFGARGPKVVFFPVSEPNQVYVYVELPVATNVQVTDSITRVVEGRINNVIGRENPDVKSVVTNIAIGVADARSMDRTTKSNKGKVTIEFVEYKERKNVNTSEYLPKLREAVKDIAGANITVEGQKGGPPTAAPVQIDITAEDFEELRGVASHLRSYLDSVAVPGVEELKWNLELDKPELMINIDREKARRLGMSTGQIGMAIRTAIFGKEATKFRFNEDDYPVQIRLDEKYRKDIPTILNMNIIYFDMAVGMQKSVPISSVATVEYRTTYGGINRRDLKKIVSLTSNVVEGFNVQEVNQEVAFHLANYQKSHTIPSSITIKAGGEIEEQKETGAFLGVAGAASMLLIFLILMIQFNSLGNVLLILSQVVFSIIGVLLGFAIVRNDISIVMTGVGIVALAGIVVRNGIILLDYFKHLEEQGMPLEDAIVNGGAIRLIPVMLTALATILGMLPLAMSININFETLLAHGDAQWFVGGDNAAFWGPLAGTIIYGLSFATIVTLLVVPVMYYIKQRARAKIYGWFGWTKKPAHNHDDQHA